MNLFQLLCCALLTNKNSFYSLLENIGGYSADTGNSLRQLRQKIGLMPQRQRQWQQWQQQQQQQHQQHQQQPRHLGEDSVASTTAEATDSSFQQFLNAALEEANYSGITLCSCTTMPAPSSDSYAA